MARARQQVAPMFTNRAMDELAAVHYYRWKREKRDAYREAVRTGTLDEFYNNWCNYDN